MAQTKIEKIASIEEEIKQLKERQKLLQQQHNAQERKDRTKRLIERGAILESLIPGADVLTNEQVKIFLEKTVQTEFARKILNGMKPQDSKPAAPKPAEAAQDNATSTAQTVGNSARQGA